MKSALLFYVFSAVSATGVQSALDDARQSQDVPGISVTVVQQGQIFSPAVAVLRTSRQGRR